MSLENVVIYPSSTHKNIYLAVACIVCEIFALKLYCDLETGVRGSLKVAESCTIESADPQKVILELNIMSTGKAVAKLWPFLYIQDGRQPPSWISSNRK